MSLPTNRFLTNEQFQIYKQLVHQGNPFAVQAYLLDVIPDDIPVYKYFRGSQRDYNTIMSSEVWAGAANIQNDPFDSFSLPNMHSQPTYDPTNQYESDLAFYEYKAQREATRIAEKEQADVLLCAFSEKNDDILMWSHYSNNHYGVCIAYNLKSIINQYDVFPVIYTDEYDVHQSELERILTKFSAWEYEAEWRLILHNNEHNNGQPVKGITPVAIFLGARCGMTTFYSYEDGSQLLDQSDIRKLRYPNDVEWMHLASQYFQCEKYLMEVERGGKYALRSTKIYGIC